MTRMSALLAIASAALATTAAAPAHALKPFTAQYDASFKGISAGGSMSLSQQGNRWTYAMGIRNAMANLSQATVFEDAAGRYRPLGGSDRSTYLMKTRSVVTHYNWKGMQARWTGDVKPQRAGPVAMQVGDMDALLVQLGKFGRPEIERPLGEKCDLGAISSQEFGFFSAVTTAAEHRHVHPPGLITIADRAIAEKPTRHADVMHRIRHLGTPVDDARRKDNGPRIQDVQFAACREVVA